MRRAPAIALGIFGAGVGIGAAGLTWGLLEARSFCVRRVRVPVLSAGPELRVLHLSDVHLMARQGAKLRWLSQLSRLRPDLVVHTGDNISQAKAVDPLVGAYGALLDVPGVFVFGSNDYYAPTFRNPLRYLAAPSRAMGPRQPDLPFAELRARFVQRGWVDLTHARARISIGGHDIEFRGTDDAHLSRDDYSQVAGPPAAGTLAIGVTHAPYRRVLDPMTADGLDLIFAGHTHGGQVCIPGRGALITNCDLDPKRAKGLSTHEHSGHRTYLHVSAGIGTSPFAPYRFACRPEATLLTLVPR